MYFRFAAAVMLTVLVALAGIAVDRRCLALRRALSREHYRYEVLRALYARQRLQTQQLGAPARLLESLESDRESLARKAPDARQPQIASESSVSTRQ
jgi:hypothetical protein